jgi:hypothetical protein
MHAEVIHDNRRTRKAKAKRVFLCLLLSEKWYNPRHHPPLSKGYRMSGEAGELTKMQAGGGTVRSVGFLLGVMVAEEKSLSPHINKSCPFIVAYVVADTFKFGRSSLFAVCLSLLSVVIIFSTRSLTQVIPFVVIGVTVYVVYQIRRLITRFHFPSNTVCSVTDSQYIDPNTPTVFVPRFCTGKTGIPPAPMTIRLAPSFVTRLPSEKPGITVVGEKFKQEFLRGEQDWFSHSEPFEREVIERRLVHRRLFKPFSPRRARCTNTLCLMAG